MAIDILGTSLITFGLNLLAFVALYVIITISLNLEIGYAGIPNFGQVLFFAGGASIGGALSGRLAVLLFNVGAQSQFIPDNSALLGSVNTILTGNPLASFGIFLFTIVCALGIGALMGFIASYPAIRLREDFLGMSLYGLGIFFWIFLDNYPGLTDGSNGIQIPAVYAWAGNNSYGIAVLAIVVFALITYFFVEKLVRSPFGRVLRSMRENETSAKALGKNIVRMRITVMVVSSSIAAVAGALYVFYTGVVLPDSVAYQIPWTVYPWLIVILGGRGNNLGVVVGAFLYEGMTDLISIVKFQFSGVIPFDVNWLYYLIVAALIVIILSTKGSGILSEKPIVTIPTSEVNQIVEQHLKKGKNSEEKVVQAAAEEGK